jgi:hypothetical protein
MKMKCTLAYFQDRGIKDRNALATIMGNIRQESTFVPNICEGGNRTGYYNCWRFWNYPMDICQSLLWIG